jgi:hypothetical protein
MVENYGGYKIEKSTLLVSEKKKCDLVFCIYFVIYSFA